MAESVNRSPPNHALLNLSHHRKIKEKKHRRRRHHHHHHHKDHKSLFFSKKRSAIRERCRRLHEILFATAEQQNSLLSNEIINKNEESLQIFANEFAYTTSLRQKHYLFWAFPWGDAENTLHNFTRTEFLDWVHPRTHNRSSSISNPLRFLTEVRITSNDISVAGRTCSMDWIGSFPILMPEDLASSQPASCSGILSGRSLYALDSNGQVIQALHHYDATTVATQVAACRHRALTNNSQPLLSVLPVNPLVAKTCRRAFLNLFPTSGQFVTILDIWNFAQETFTPLQASSIVSGHPQLYFSWPEGSRDKNGDDATPPSSSSLSNFVPNDLILWFLQHTLWNPQKGVLKYTAQLETDTVAVIGPVCSMNVRLVAQTTGPSSCPIELPMRLWIKVHVQSSPPSTDNVPPHHSTRKLSKHHPHTVTTVDTWMLHYDEEALQHQIMTCDKNFTNTTTVDDTIVGSSAAKIKSEPSEASNPTTTRGKTTAAATTTTTTTVIIPSHGMGPLLQANHYPVLLLLLATVLFVFLVSAATSTKRLAHHPLEGDQPGEAWHCREPQQCWCEALGTSEEKTRLIASC